MAYIGKVLKDWTLLHTKELWWNKIGGCLTHAFLSQTSKCFIPEEEMKHLDFFNCFPKPYNYLNFVLEFNLEPEERINCYNLVLPRHQRIISGQCQHLNSESGACLVEQEGVVLLLLS